MFSEYKLRRSLISRAASCRGLPVCKVMRHITMTALPTFNIGHERVRAPSVIVLSVRGTTQAMRTGFARCWFVSSQSVVRQGTPMSSVESKGVLCVRKSSPKRKRWRHNSSSPALSIPATLIYNSPATSQRLKPEFANQHQNSACAAERLACSFCLPPGTLGAKEPQKAAVVPGALQG